MIGNTSRTNTKCPGTFKHLSIGNCTVHYFWQIDNERAEMAMDASHNARFI